MFRCTALLAAALAACGPAAADAPPTLPSPVRMLWIDNEADPASISTTASVEALVAKAADVGFNVLVSDVKQFEGILFYDSAESSRPATIKGKPYPQDFDFLQAVIDAAHPRGLRVLAGINLFAEGRKQDGGVIGPAAAHPEWLSTVYDTIVHLNVGGDPTTVSRVNDRGDTGLSAFLPRHGRAVAARDHASAVIDGVAGSAASRWVSAATSGPHTLTFEWPEPVTIDSADIIFPRGFPARVIEVTAGGRRATAEDNRSLTATLSLGSHSPQPTTSCVVRFPAPPPDGMIRVEEVRLLDPSGANAATSATVAASSSLARARAVAAVVHDDRITTIVSEPNWPGGLLPIPSNGFIVLAEDDDTAVLVEFLPLTASARLTTATVILPVSAHPRGILAYVNPAHPAVRERQLRIISEIMSNYKVDGVVLDRGRYDHILADFSPLSRRLFEETMGVKAPRFPADILTPPDPLTGAPLAPGPLFGQWLTFRATVIRDFMADARAAVRRHPGKIFGDYVGAWYATYHEVGANWASHRYDPSADFPWAPPAYAATGYAQMLDLLSPGVYYTAITKADSPADPAQSIEGGIELAQHVTRHAVPLAPGLYAPGFNSPDAFEQAVRLSIQKTSGVMIFSQTGLDSAGYWDAARRGLEASPVHLE